MNMLHHIYPVCSQLTGDSLPSLADDQLLKLADYLDNNPDYLRRYPYLADLARIEAARFTILNNHPPLPEPDSLMVNPNLTLLEVGWQGLPVLLQGKTCIPKKNRGYVIIWQMPGEATAKCGEANPHDLLALKLVTEKTDSRTAAMEGGITVGTIDDILLQAVRKGLLLSPPPRITRPPEFKRDNIANPKFYTAPTFTLQWHITQNCDLHCRHCYDRSIRTEPSLADCTEILDQLYDFCQEHRVFAQVTFTGGNPLLYPHFQEVYQEAADRGFMTAILGNPVPERRLDELIVIQKPEFYQVSLEGLRDHNDYIRGSGHFDRIFDFLDVLRKLDIYSMVMLTLTRANMNQVLELAELLRHRVDLFTFNRLAMVGGGTELAPVTPEQFRDFLAAYLIALPENPCLGIKDNLFNLVKDEQNQPCFGGCTGKGCGAAFNFVALLPDGEVHACRKFPSYIGNIYQTGLRNIYNNEKSRQYRSASQACSHCRIRPVCRGCMAVSYGLGLDIFQDKDPYCWHQPGQTSMA